MRTTITLPDDLASFLERERETINQSKSGYIGLLLKRCRENGGLPGVTLNMTPRKQKSKGGKK